MIMITILELCAALIGLYLLYRELVVRKSQNFMTSVFTLCYVPLFCVYPLISRLIVGGATSVNRYQPGTINDVESYVVYQVGNLAFLAMIWFAGRGADQPPVLPVPSQPERGYVNYLAAMVCVGIYLGIYATGLSVPDLFAAGRFTWFHHKDYSPVLALISGYLIALSPLFVYFCVVEGRWRTLAFVIVLLVLNGLLFKDRKWLIFIGSGLLAAHFFRSGRRLTMTKKTVWWLVAFAMTLWFWQVARYTVHAAVAERAIGYLWLTPQVMADSLVRGDIPYYYNASMTAIHMHLQDGYEIPFGLLRRQLFFFLPASFSFGLKIEDISAIFSDAIGGGDPIRRGNMPPGFFGLFVLSFGWLFGGMTLILFPLLLKMLDRITRLGTGWGYACIASYGFSSTIYLLRGDDSSATYFPFFALLMMFWFEVARKLAANVAFRWSSRR